MLTPEATDPNREDELRRREAQPTAFGTNELLRMPKDWNPSGSLSEDKVSETAEDADTQTEKSGKKTGKR